MKRVEDHPPLREKESFHRLVAVSGVRIISSSWPFSDPPRLLVSTDCRELGGTLSRIDSEAAETSYAHNLTTFLGIHSKGISGTSTLWLLK